MPSLSSLCHYMNRDADTICFSTLLLTDTYSYCCYLLRLCFLTLIHTSIYLSYSLNPLLVTAKFHSTRVPPACFAILSRNLSHLSFYSSQSCRILLMSAPSSNFQLLSHLNLLKCPDKTSHMRSIPFLSSYVSFIILLLTHDLFIYSYTNIKLCAYCLYKTHLQCLYTLRLFTVSNTLPIFIQSPITNYIWETSLYCFILKSLIYRIWIKALQWQDFNNFESEISGT